MNSEKPVRQISMLLVAATVLYLPNAEAALPNLASADRVQGIVVPIDALTTAGISGTVMNLRGEVREIQPGELLKVRFHEEKGILDFSSFDGYSRSIYEMATAPRNLY
jgi:hypothetical protein